MLAMAESHGGETTGRQRTNPPALGIERSYDSRAENASYALPVIETYAWPHAVDDTNIVTPWGVRAPKYCINLGESRREAKLIGSVIEPKQ